MAKIKPGKRLYLTKDKDKLVGEGDSEAAFLYCTEYSEVDKEEYTKLVGGRKERRSYENKEAYSEAYAKKAPKKEAPKKRGGK